MTTPYRVEPRNEGCPTCQHGDQFDIVGPAGQEIETSQSQSWGDREEADYICELMERSLSSWPCLIRTGSDGAHEAERRRTHGTRTTTAGCNRTSLYLRILRRSSRQS
jgi:hypothetical protein